MSKPAFRLQILIFRERELSFDTPQPLVRLRSGLLICFLGLALPLTAVAALVALAAAAGPTSNGVDRRIVYASNWTPHFRTSDIYAVAVRGGLPRNLTNNEIDDLDPALSPDGHQIAFARAARHGLDLFLMNRDGSGLRRLVSRAGPERQPAWSPDGHALAFAAPGSLRNEKGWRPEQLFLVNRDGSGLRELTHEEEGVNEPAWSPDGTKLAAVLGGGTIATLNRDGSGLQPISFGGDDDEDLDPAWSPDGRRIAFTRTRSSLNTNDLWVMDADGSHRRRLAKFGAQPAWSPDGSRIAFINGPVWSCKRDGCYDDGLTAIATIAASGGRKHFVTGPLERAGEDFLGSSSRWSLGEGASFFKVAWTPDGKKLVYARRLEQRAPDLFSISPHGGAPRRLTATAAAETNPVVSPDGRRVAFNRYRPGPAFPDLYTMRVGGGGLHRVSVNAVSPSWSPDGRRLAFVGLCWHGGMVERGVFTATPEGSDRRRIAHTTTPSFRSITAASTPSWSPDGRRIAYIEVSGVGSSEREAITVASADGTAARQLLVLRRRYAYYLSWSLVGDLLAFTNASRGQLGRRHSSWIELVSAEEGWTRRLTQAPFDDYGPVWSPAATMLAFTRRTRSPYSENSTVCVVRTSGGGARCLGKLRWHDGEPSWAPDGSRLVLASLRDGDSDIYTVRPDGHGRRKLTHDIADDAQPSW